MNIWQFSRIFQRKQNTVALFGFSPCNFIRMEQLSLLTITSLSSTFLLAYPHFSKKNFIFSRCLKYLSPETSIFRRAWIPSPKEIYFFWQIQVGWILSTYVCQCFSVEVCREESFFKRNSYNFELNPSLKAQVKLIIRMYII